MLLGERMVGIGSSAVRVHIARGSAPSITRATLRYVVGPQLNERDGVWLSSAVERIAARHAIETRYFRTAEQCMRVLCAR